MINTQRITVAIPSVLAIVGILASAFFFIYSNSKAQSSVMEDAKASAMQLIQRSAQMFMISSDKFHNEYTIAEKSGDKSAVLQDWIRTIRAVDQAVVYDYGDGKNRVRLLGDSSIVGEPPFGGKDTEVRTSFERELLSTFAAGDWTPSISTDEDNEIFRMGIALSSDMHPGCAQCHNIPIEDSRLLGGLVAYIPIKDALSAARYGAIENGMLTAGIFFTALLVIYFLVRRKVLRPLEELRAATEELATGSGDLTYRIKNENNDEISAVAINLNSFIEKLQSSIQKMNQSMHTLTDVTNKSSIASSTTVSIIGKQRGETHKVSESISQLNTMANEMDEHSKSALMQVEIANTSAKNSDSRVTDMLGTLENLASILNNAKDNIVRLESDSKNIGGILDVIKSIAQQTNLLALNAAIEAARAGEQGRGFAVVADEVRSLARRTQESIQEIESTIESVQSVSGVVVEIISAGHSEGEETVFKAREAATSLNDVLISLEQLHEKNTSISQAANSQSKVVADALNSVSQINLLNENTANQANEAKSVGVELTDVSNQIKEFTGRFKV